MAQKARMCVIGFGRMGKRCAKLFSDGFEVEVISRRDIRTEARERGAEQSVDVTKSLSEADFIFLAVPIEALDAWIPKINDLAKPHSVVMDCCTVRRAANEKLSRIQRRRFGIPALGTQVRVDGEPDERIQEYLEQRGCRLSAIDNETPQERPVAGIAHFIGMALDLNLTEDERSAMTGSPACRYLLQSVGHLKSNSPSTYKETELLDIRTSGRRKEVIAWSKECDEELDRGVFRFQPYPRRKWRE